MPVSLRILLVFQTCSPVKCPLSPVYNLTFVKSLLSRVPLYHTYFCLTFSHFSLALSLFTHSFCYNLGINFKKKHVAIIFTVRQFDQFSLSTDLYITWQCLCSEASGVESHMGCWGVSQTARVNTTRYSVPHMTPDPVQLHYAGTRTKMAKFTTIAIPVTKDISITLRNSC
jgi:hypothetical protein